MKGRSPAGEAWGLQSENINTAYRLAGFLAVLLVLVEPVTGWIDMIFVFPSEQTDFSSTATIRSRF